MRLAAPILVLCLVPAAAAAEEASSAVTPFDLEKTCQQIEKGDGLISAGTWSCPGGAGQDILVTLWDEHSYVGFGPGAGETCAYARTFRDANTALSPVEWRLAGGKPFAAIQGWRVTSEQAGGSSSWLVVTALKGQESCPVHYVEGASPEAMAEARRAADALAPNFDCDHDVPTLAPGADADAIDLISCAEMTDQ